MHISVPGSIGEISFSVKLPLTIFVQVRLLKADCVKIYVYNKGHIVTRSTVPCKEIVLISFVLVSISNLVNWCM